MEEGLEVIGDVYKMGLYCKIFSAYIYPYMSSAPPLTHSPNLTHWDCMEGLEAESSPKDLSSNTNPSPLAHVFPTVTCCFGCLTPAHIKLLRTTGIL